MVVAVADKRARSSCGCRRRLDSRGAWPGGGAAAWPACRSGMWNRVMEARPVRSSPTPHTRKGAGNPDWGNSQLPRTGPSV